MTLDLLDLLLVCQWVFNQHVPWWMWILGILSNVGTHVNLKELRKR